MPTTDAEAAFHAAVEHMRALRPGEALPLFRDAAHGFATAHEEQAEAGALHGEAVALGRLGRAAEAIPGLVRSLEVHRRLLHPQAFDIALDLGRLHEDVGQPERALEIYEGLRDASEAPLDLRAQAAAVNAVGRALTDLARFAEARAAFETALPLRIQADDRRGEGVTRSGLGGVLIALDEHEEAAGHLRVAVDIAHERGDDREEAVARGELARALCHGGDRDSALETAHTALSLARVGGDVMELADKLTLVGELSTGQDDPTALALLDDAIAIYAATHQRERHAALLRLTEPVLMRLGRSREALERVLAAADLYTDTGDEEARAHAVVLAADILRQLGRAGESIALVAPIAPAAAAAGQVAVEASARVTLGMALEATGRLPEARREHTIARSLCDDAELKPLDCLAASGSSRVLRLSGELTEALTLAEEALVLGESVVEGMDHEKLLCHGDGLLANLHAEVGRVYEALDRIGPALEHFEQALDTSDRYVRAAALCSTAKLLGQVGREDDAATMLAEAITEARDIQAPQTEAVALDLFGGLLAASDRQAAIQHHGEAARLFAIAGDRQGEGAALHNAGMLLSNAEAALPVLQRSLDIARETGDVIGEGACLRSIGDALLRRGSPDDALNAYLGAIAPARTGGDRRLELAALTDAGRALLRLGRIDDAAAQLREAMEVLDGLRADAVLPEFRQALVADVREAFPLMVECLAELAARTDGVAQEQHLAEAFAVSEQARSRAFAETWSEARRSGGLSDAESPLQDERLELTTRLRDLARRQRAAEPDERAALGAEIRGVERRLQLLHVRLLTAFDTATSSLPAFATASVEDTRAILMADRGTVVLEYLLGRDAGYVIAVDAERIEIHQIPDRRTLEELCVGHHEALATARERAPHAAELYGALLAPAEEMLASAEHLVIVPDGAMHAVAWPLLEYEGHRVIDRFTVRSAPSATLVVAGARSAPATGASRSLVAFGDPTGEDKRLPQSAREVSAIGRLFDPLVPVVAPGELDPPPISYTSDEGAVVIRTRRHATKRAFLQAVAHGGGQRHLHVATHGFANAESPQLSGLVFSNSPEEQDPYLHAFEVASLRLECDLCVLSACETGIGRLVHGEGIVGLWRAFAIAGARSLCASLWRIDDRASADLMVRLYEHLRAGADVATALRHAQLETAEKHPHPYYWAGFQVVL